MRIGREMGRNHGVHTVAACGCKISGDLVSRVLHHWKKLHVGEAHFLDVGGKEGGDFPVGEETSGAAPPGAKMDFVNSDRGLPAILFSAPTHPGLICPGVSEVPNNGGGFRWRLRKER